MSVKDFLLSKVFFKQVAIALVLIIIIVFALMQYLSYATNHGQEIPVPDLRKMTVEKAKETLENADLEYVVLDTVEFKADYPPYTVVKQDPLPKVNVKDGRKVYIKINSSGYNKVEVPDLIQKTYRAALPMLKSSGLEEGKKTYVPYLAKDVVLELKQNGKKLKPGDKVLKASKIDFVLGDGKTGFVESEKYSDDSGDSAPDTDKNTETETN
jgi:beta-lactam-binding protein with PASTA domain